MEVAVEEHRGRGRRLGREQRERRLPDVAVARRGRRLAVSSAYGA